MDKEDINLLEDNENEKLDDFKDNKQYDILADYILDSIKFHKQFNEKHEQWKKNKENKKYKKTNLLGKCKIIIPKIAVNRYILFITQLITSAIVILTIYINTNHSISDLQNTINDMNDKNTIIQKDLAIAILNIQQVNQQLSIQNKTLMDIQIKEKLVVDVLDKLNLTSVLHQVSYIKDTIDHIQQNLNTEIQRINASVLSLQSILVNNTKYMDNMYNYTIKKMSSQANATISSLYTLNQTLWNKTFNIDLQLNNMHDNIIDFEIYINYMFANLASFITKFKQFIKYWNIEC
jgi:AraC-like DNA-binding protein